MSPLAEMIAQNVCRLRDPTEQRLMVSYITNALPYCTFKFNRAKKWKDFLFRPRYYYTRCSTTLDILSKIQINEMARHVIAIESSIFAISTTHLLNVESIVRTILDRGLYVIGYHQEEPFLITSTQDVFKASSIELVVEGLPFEQEYVTDLVGFHAWLKKRLPQVTPYSK
jgi:hypothetical protein